MASLLGERHAGLATNPTHTGRVELSDPVKRFPFPFSAQNALRGSGNLPEQFGKVFRQANHQRVRGPIWSDRVPPPTQKAAPAADSQPVRHTFPGQTPAATLLNHKPNFVEQVRVSLQCVEQIRFLRKRRIVQEHNHTAVLSRPVHWK